MDLAEDGKKTKNILVSISVASVQQEQLIEGWQEDVSLIS